MFPLITRKKPERAHPIVPAFTLKIKTLFLSLRPLQSKTIYMSIIFYNM